MVLLTKANNAHLQLRFQSTLKDLGKSLERAESLFQIIEK
jgi:hypothetical protein